MKKSLVTIMGLNFIHNVGAFGNQMLVSDKAPTMIPEKSKGIPIEMPDFEKLFSRIQSVSPLAQQAIQHNSGGFFAINEQNSSMKWKVIESNEKKTVHHIDKIENFQNLGCPVLRFRSSLRGPCLGSSFADFIMNIDHRKKWDVQIQEVEKLYPFEDLEAANNMMGNGSFGLCTNIGVGYCQTKKNMVVSSREQLVLCGVQEIPQNGATVIWGTELEDRYNHLLPPGKRYTRARSHLFSTALVPTGPDTFDVEYVIQLESGGKIPTWMTTPVISETVKSLFEYAKHYYGAFPKSQVNNLAFMQNCGNLKEY